MTNEEIRDKIARHFGLGDYGVRLAQEYLDEYAHNLAIQISQDPNCYTGEFAAMLIDPDPCPYCLTD